MRRKRLKKQPVCCGQNFRDWIGYKIVGVQSNKLDLNVRITLMNQDMLLNSFLMIWSSTVIHYSILNWTVSRESVL